MIELSTEETRIIGLCAPQLFKLLRAREDRILNKMYGAFRNQEKNILTVVAEWASVRDQINEITNVLNQHNQTEEKKHGNATS